MKNKTKTRKLSANYMDLVFTKNAEIQWRVKEDGFVEVDMVNKGFFNSIAQFIICQTAALLSLAPGLPSTRS